MKRRLQWRILACTVLWIAAMVPACAQSGQTSSSTLVVSMTVQSSISLEFVNSSNTGEGYCQVSGAGTNSASLNLGIATISGDSQSCVNWYYSSPNINLATNLYLEVNQSNSTSTSYSLTAALSSTPPNGVTWKFASMSGNLSTSPQTVTSSQSYASQYDMYMTIVIPSSLTAQNLSQAITFTATAN